VVGASSKNNEAKTGRGAESEIDGAESKHPYLFRFLRRQRTYKHL
jgi:hypothetical protein